VATYETIAEWQAAQGGGGSPWKNIWEIDFSTLGSDTWADGTQAITATAGDNLVSVNWTVGNQGNSTTFGPDGANGVVIDPTSSPSTLWWSSSDTAPYIEADLADLLGEAMSRDDVYSFQMEWSGDVIGANYEAVGLGVVDSTTKGPTNRVRYANGEKWTPGRFNSSTSHSFTDVALIGVTGTQIVIFGGGVGYRCGRSTTGIGAVGDMMDQSNAAKDFGTMISNTPGNTAQHMDVDSLKVKLFVEKQGGAAAYSQTLSKFSLWKK